MSDIKPGDVVTLASGGDPWTVKDVRETTAEIVRYAPYGGESFRVARLPLVTLRKVEPEPPRPEMDEETRTMLVAAVHVVLEDELMQPEAAVVLGRWLDAQGGEVMGGCGRDVGAFRTCGTEGILCLECAPASEPQPIYLIFARDVVPGMLVEGQAVVRVWRELGALSDMVRGQLEPGHLGGFMFHETHLVKATLPGASPRELCCTCALRGVDRGHAAPDGHLLGCPVAPVEGVHGGMRLWPAPAGPIQGWGCRHGVYNWTSRRGGFGPWAIGSEMIVESRCGDGILDDTLLAAFYHPPAPPIEKPKARCWDPYPGALLDLAGRWG